MKNIQIILILFILTFSISYSQCDASNWQDFYPDMQGCNFDGSNLSNQDLSGTDLSGAIFTAGYFGFTNFSGADLSDADFSGANAESANFNEANLNNTNFQGAYLNGVILCTYTGTPLNMGWQETFFTEEDCTGECGDAVLDCSGVCDGDAYEDECGTCDSDPSNDCITCDASNWQDFYPDMQGCNFDGSNLAGLDFTGTDLSEATFGGAYLGGGVNFSYSNLEYASFWGAYAAEAIFVGANIEGTNFNGAYMLDALMCETTGTPINLPGNVITESDCAGVCGGDATEEECGGILGCTDETANNYNQDATEDDGSCSYSNTITITDIDGNSYETIQIGDQLWMAENLKTTHYKNGDEILTELTNSEWISTDEGAYSIYNNDPENFEIYGNLYNWYAAVDDRGVCPEGWHLPSDDEYKTLELNLGMVESELSDIGYRGTNEGSKFAGDANLWHNGNLDQNNSFGESGFNLLPSGFRNYNNGNYEHKEKYGFVWTSTEIINTNYAYHRDLYFNYTGISRWTYVRTNGLSIRCLADEGTTGNTTVEGCTDENAQNYNPMANTDDGSCQCFPGDVTGDANVDVLDIVMMVDYILDWFDGSIDESPLEVGCGDINDDGEVNISDIVFIIHTILNPEILGRGEDATFAELVVNNNILKLQTDGYIGGIQLRITHDEKMEFILSNNTMLSESRTLTDETLMIILEPKDEILFTTNGEPFTIKEVKVLNSQEEINVSVVNSFILHNAYPNPFNPVTTLSFELIQTENVSLKIYDVQGKEVANLLNANLSSGNHEVQWNAKEYSSGIYIARLQAGSDISTQKLMLLK